MLFDIETMTAEEKEKWIRTNFLHNFDIFMRFVDLYLGAKKKAQEREQIDKIRKKIESISGYSFLTKLLKVESNYISRRREQQPWIKQVIP